MKIPGGALLLVSLIDTYGAEGLLIGTY